MERAGRALRSAAVVALLAAGWAGCADNSSTDTNPTGQTTGDTTPDAVVSSNGTTGGTTDGGTTGGDTTPAPDCLPSRAVWEETVAPMVETSCGQCHGATPDFGAPNSLIDYDAMVAGEEGSRLVDRIVARMSDATMPPASYPRPSHVAQDTIIAWASCGAAHPDYSVGLEATAPVFLAPEEPPADAEEVELRTGGFPVGPDVLDLYQCFVFDAPVGDADKFIRRMEVLVDESRVLHHVVFMRGPADEVPQDKFRCRGLPDFDYLYGWAPGAGPLQFPDGGLRLTPDERLVIQIHYNNGAGLEGIEDNSGVKVYLSEPEGTEYGMMSPGPFQFRIPAGSVTEVDGVCEFNQEYRVLAGMPHMHETGKEFHQTITRADGTEESFISLTGWSFELQLYYDTPVTLRPGDKLNTTCVYENMTDRDVTFGTGTGDEMCYNFMYVTPPPDIRFCDGESGRQDFDYTPGQCLGEPVSASPPPIKGEVEVLDALPEMTNGALEGDGWVLDRFDLLITPENSLLLDFVDLDASTLLGKGQLRRDGDQLHVDVAAFVSLRVNGEGVNFDTTLPYSFTLGEVGDDTASLSLEQLACGEAEDLQVSFGAGEAGDIEALLQIDFGPAALPILLTFRKAVQ